MADHGQLVALRQLVLDVAFEGLGVEDRPQLVSEASVHGIPKPTESDVIEPEVIPPIQHALRSGSLEGQDAVFRRGMLQQVGLFVIPRGRPHQFIARG